MPRLRNKKTRGYLEFYRRTFQMQEPYKVLLDPTFISSFRRSDELADAVASLLTVPAKRLQLFVPECALVELRQLAAARRESEPLQRAVRLCHQCQVWYCKAKNGAVDDTGAPMEPRGSTHDPCMCTRCIVGAHNEHKFIVISNDKGLRRSLAKIPGVPTCYCRDGGVMIFEKPSEASLAAQNTVQGVDERERSYYEARAAPVPQTAAQMAGLANPAPAPSGAAASAAASRGHRIGGANPLSRRPKTNQPAPARETKRTRSRKAAAPATSD